MADPTCTCGAPRQPRRKYCSDKCKYRSWRINRREQRKEYQVRYRERVRSVLRFICVVCGNRFGSEIETVKYCSTKCEGVAKAARYRRNWPQTKIRYVECEGCGRLGCLPRARQGKWWCGSPCQRDPRKWIAGRCQRCGDPFVVFAVEAKYCSDRCSTRDARSRRRARLRNAYIEPVYRYKVFERDGWRCQICRRPVRRTAKVPHPRAPTVDHIVPLDAGGEHSMRNGQCACFQCNSWKGPRAANDQLLLFG